MKSFDDQLYEYIQDITCNNLLSDCCGEFILYPDICSCCKEHCEPIYAEIICECGGSISAADDFCKECNKKLEIKP